MISEFLVTFRVAIDTRNNEVQAKEMLLGEEAPQPTVTLKGSLLEFNNLAIKLLNLKIGDGIYIMYDNGEPIIGSAYRFNLQGGKKLTRRGTVPYRGKERELLEKHGTQFRLEFTDEYNIFKLVPFDNQNFNINNIKL